MVYWGPALILVSTVAALGWRMPRVAAEVALAAGIVAIADALVFFAAYSVAPRENGCVKWHSSVYDLRSMFFLVGAVAAGVSAGAGVVAAVRRQRPARSLLVAAGSVAAGVVCFFLLLFIGICGD